MKDLGKNINVADTNTKSASVRATKSGLFGQSLNDLGKDINVADTNTKSKKKMFLKNN